MTMTSAFGRTPSLATPLTVFFDRPNVATVGIEGDRNYVDVSQTYDNDATVTIDGDDNDVTATQTVGATTTVTFNGNNNYVGVIQNDTSTATIAITVTITIGRWASLVPLRPHSRPSHLTCFRQSRCRSAVSGRTAS